MKALKEMNYHPKSEELVDVLCEKTQNTDRQFFRVMTAYYFSVVASTMRCSIETLDHGKIPVNTYAINSAPSGLGKGHAMNIIEDQVIQEFQERFFDEILPAAAKKNLEQLSLTIGNRNSTDPQEELEKLEKEYENTGPLLFSFDSATPAAIKQIRHKLLLSKVGSLNFCMDEIGNNLLGNTDVLNTFIELYDMGKIKPKLIKNTTENQRNTNVKGITPANMLLFGTPTSLLDGAKVEDEFLSMLETGYARRCIFGYIKSHKRLHDLSPEEILKRRMNSSSGTTLIKLSDQIGSLAQERYLDTVLSIDEKVTLLFIKYEQQCLRIAEKFKEYEETLKIEAMHRHSKALKLAGVYAFIEGSLDITEDHAYAAIKLMEDSGNALQNMMNRDKPYIRLCNYLADVSHPVTQADLIEDLPFYKGSQSQKADLLTLATAYGYQNNIIIKQTLDNGITFLQGESLEKTDIDNLVVSYSSQLAAGYHNDTAPFDKLHKLTNKTGMHWCNHHFTNSYRSDETTEEGFNMIVLDMDDGTKLSTVLDILKEYTLMAYTTKSHTKESNRFRIILPTNFKLYLNQEDYKEFMHNLFTWLPFSPDSQTGQRSRKWLSYDGHYVTQKGKLLDVLPFIPKTSKNEKYKKQFIDQAGLSNIQRWMLDRVGEHGRNNTLVKFALVLVDAGHNYQSVLTNVMELNQLFKPPLTTKEIMNTVMVTAKKKINS